MPIERLKYFAELTHTYNFGLDIDSVVLFKLPYALLPVSFELSEGFVAWVGQGHIEIARRLLHQSLWGGVLLLLLRL